MIILSLKSNKSIYFLHTNSMVKKFKHRFYIKELLIWICKPAKNADSDQYKYSTYGIGPTQWLDDTTLTAEAIYPINFTQANKRFALNLQYIWSNTFLFVNATKKYINSKQKALY